MICLRDKDTGTTLGMISEQQLQFLRDQLEEESPEDDDYYINQATLEMLEEQGADRDVLDLLKQALGAREDMEIQWSRE